MCNSINCESLKNHFLDPYTLVPLAVQTALLPIETLSERVSFLALELVGSFALKSSPFLDISRAQGFLDVQLQRITGKSFWNTRVTALLSTAAILGTATLGASWAYSYCASWALKGLITGLYLPIAKMTAHYVGWRVIEPCLDIPHDSRTSSRARQIASIASWTIQFGCLATGFTPISAIAIGCIAGETFRAAYKRLAVPAEIKPQNR